VTAALRRPFGSLAVPNYRRYFTGQIISLSGNWMQIVAEVWLVLQLTHSGVAVGITTASQFAPILLFGAYGGVVADRFDKRRLLMVTQAAMVLPALALIGLFRLHAIGADPLCGAYCVAMVPAMVAAMLLRRGEYGESARPGATAG
jgi:nitrate/nitrite transporter NarK